MEVAPGTFDEIRGHLLDADYHHAVDDESGTLDMHGVGLVRAASPPGQARNLLLGIDPGKDGAAAVIDDAGKVVACIPARWNGKALQPLTVEAIGTWAPRIRAAAIEEVIMFKDGASAAMTGRAIALSAGVWIGVLGTLGVFDVRWTRPQTWQSRVKLTFPRKVKGASKAAACALAGAIYGDHAKEAILAYGDGVADALLIAEWLRQEMRTEMFTAAAR